MPATSSLNKLILGLLSLSRNSKGLNAKGSF